MSIWAPLDGRLRYISQQDGAPIVSPYMCTAQLGKKCSVARIPRYTTQNSS